MSAHVMATANLPSVHPATRPAANRELSTSSVLSTSSTSSTRSACDQGTCLCATCEALAQQCKLGNLSKDLLPSQFCTHCAGFSTSQVTKSIKSGQSSIKSSETTSSSRSSKFAELSFRKRLSVIMNISARGF